MVTDIQPVRSPARGRRRGRAGLVDLVVIDTPLPFETARPFEAAKVADLGRPRPRDRPRRCPELGESDTDAVRRRGAGRSPQGGGRASSRSGEPPAPAPGVESDAQP